MLNTLSAPLGWLAVGSAAIFILGLLYWRVRADGASAARAKRERERAAARDISDGIDDKLAGRDSTSQREELREWGKR